MGRLTFEEQGDTFSIVMGRTVEKQVFTNVGFIFGGKDVREFPSNDVYSIEDFGDGRKFEIIVLQSGKVRLLGKHSRHSRK